MPISDKDWNAFLASIRQSSKTTKPRQDFLAQNISMRNSQHNAIATMAVFFDVTGSMGTIPQQFVDGALLTLINEIANRQSIPNAEIMFGAVGDLECDAYPLQATHFNTGIKAAEELRQLFIEGGGGTNSYESYPAAWLFAAHKTNPVSLEHGQKGILFTMGDELYPAEITSAQMLQHLGIRRSLAGRSSALEESSNAISRLTSISTAVTHFFAPNTTSALTTFTPAAELTRRRRPTNDALSNALLANNNGSQSNVAQISNAISTQEILALAQQKYEIFHLVLKADHQPEVFAAWKKLLGDKAIPVNTNDINKVAEIIVSIIDRFYARKEARQVALSWQNREVQLAVQNSIANLGTLALIEHPSFSTGVGTVTGTATQPALTDQETMQFLSAHGFSPEVARINNFNSNGDSPLTSAVKMGDYAASYNLVHSGADINTQLQSGDTALHVALRLYNKPNMAQIVQWLLQSGANLDLANNHGLTPRRLALELNIPLQSLNSNALLENAHDAPDNDGPCSWLRDTCKIC